MSDSHVTLVKGEAREEAGIASGILRPGMLVEMTGTGRQWQAQNMVGAQIVAAFAREQFENNGAGIEDTIASGDDFTVIFPEKGAQVLCICASTLTRGTLVGSAGNGNVQAADSEHAIGQVAEATFDHGALLRVLVTIF